MASVARFGFEGGLIPSSVTIKSASFVSGRNGGTAVEAVADGASSYDATANVSVRTISSNTIFYSCQMKRVAANSNVSMSLVQFGNVWVTYDPSASRVYFRRGKFVSPGYDTLFTSAATVNFPVDTWIPVSGKFVISPTAGEIAITIDGTAYSATTLNTSQALANSFSANTMTAMVVPQNVTSVTVTASGAGGGNSGGGFLGGKAGYVSGILSVFPGQTYWVVAGSAGTNTGTAGVPGGGPGVSDGGGGGGYSGIFTGSTAAQGNAVVVAGAGAGGQGQGTNLGTQYGGYSGASNAPLQGGNGAGGGAGSAGGGGGYVGGLYGIRASSVGAQGGSSFLRADVASQVNTYGGGVIEQQNGYVTVSGSYDTQNLYFGLGVTRSNVVVGCPTFQLDDVAVNNIYTASNATGSVGLSDYTVPPFISSRLVTYIATGSQTSGWTVPGGNITASIGTSSGQYITASFYPRPVLELAPSNSLSGVSTVEGINYYYSGAYREGSSNVYIIPHFMLNDTSSVGGDPTFLLSSFQSSGNASIFEKDLGGKLTYSEFVNGKVALDSTQWINKNFFGRGTLGDVRYTASINVGDSSIQGDYVTVEYNNLIIDSGATLSVSGTKKGLIIYVKENCIINGTISMDAQRAASGSAGFIFDKNISTASFSEYSSSLHTAGTLVIEQLFQPFYSGFTSECGITGSFTAGGTAAIYNQNGNVGGTGTNRQCGGGGSGGGEPQTAGQSGGAGGTSGTYSGGSGGGGAGTTSNGGSAAPNGGLPGLGGGATFGGDGGYGGGVIYLIVGKTLLHNGIITANGSNGTNGAGTAGGGGGGGGGSVNIFYGRNFVNTGTTRANGGTGGGGGTSGGAGGAGSVSINKILTN